MGPVERAAAMAEAAAAENLVGAAMVAAVAAGEAEAAENLGAAVRVAEGRSATAAVPRDGPEGG